MTHIIELSPDKKRQLIAEMQGFFLERRDEEIGGLFAELLLDFMLEKIGPGVYNQAIQDACAFMNEKVEDLYGLEKR